MIDFKAGVTLDDLWEIPSEDNLPPLDRSDASPKTELQQKWVDDGVLIFPEFLPADLVDAYCNSWDTPPVHGEPCLYLQHSGARRLCQFPPLHEVLEQIIGEPMGVHLNLIGWVSTNRDWHQDDYLNPSYINGHYVAVWMALGDIHPDSGPFEFVRGSHKWPLLRKDKVLTALNEPLPNGLDGAWPERSETLLSPLFEERFSILGVEPERFIAKKGDLLVWHSRLAHRGSKANVPGMERRALIAHYSALSKRIDMPTRVQEDGNYLFIPPGRSLSG